MLPDPMSFSAEIWVYSGKAAWFFVTVPEAESGYIRMIAGQKPKRGWKSVKVRVKIGQSEWQTSMFPDSKTGCYLLPIKAEIRKQENIGARDIIEISVWPVMDDIF